MQNIVLISQRLLVLNISSDLSLGCITKLDMQRVHLTFLAVKFADLPSQPPLKKECTIFNISSNSKKIDCVYEQFIQLSFRLSLSIPLEVSLKD